MAKTKTTDTIVKLIELLTPLTSEERARLIAGALTVLGDAPVPAAALTPAAAAAASGSTVATGAKAKNWIKQNGLTAEEIEQVFHIADGKAEVITSSVPGTTDSKRTLNAYILAGVAALLEKDDAKFTDEEGRALCKTLGCFNRPNHATYLGNKGNDFNGSKAAGWHLTTPGLKTGANLIKELAKANG